MQLQTNYYILLKLTEHLYLRSFHRLMTTSRDLELWR